MDSYEIGTDMVPGRHHEFKMAALNVYNPAYLIIYL